MYGFGIEYPNTWEVEIGPRSTPTSGDLAFRTRGIRIFLSWGPLQEKKEKFDSLDSQVADSIKRMQKSSDVRKFEIVDHKEMIVGGHRALFNSARLTLGVGLMAMKASKREVCSLHLYCEESQKFFALYVDGIGEGTLVMVSEIFTHMSEALKCHS
jgi:hypothetical protein